MQSGELKEEYNKKLDELIEFFKMERDKTAQYYNSIREEYKFLDTSLMSQLAFVMSLMAIAISISISSIILDKSKLFVIFGFLFIVFIIILVFHRHSTSKRTINNFVKYYNTMMGYDTVIVSLQYLKIKGIEVDLSPLLDNIEQQLFRDKTTFFDEIWIKEVINSIIMVINKAKIKP